MKLKQTAKLSYQGDKKQAGQKGQRSQRQLNKKMHAKYIEQAGEY